MLKAEMIKKLNDQLNLEFYSANLYLQMSAWCEVNNLTNIAKFLRQHSKEEMEHMERLFDYLTDTGALPLIDKVDAPTSEYTSVLALFDMVYAHEQKITQKINELVDYALQSKDYPSFQFLQWYVSEQHEEEKLFKTIRDKVEVISKSTEHLLFLDNDFAKLIG